MEERERINSWQFVIQNGTQCPPERERAGSEKSCSYNGFVIQEILQSLCLPSAVKLHLNDSERTKIQKQINK